MDFLILSLIKAAIIAFVLLTTLAYLQWIERKVIAHVQLRVGPYRVGPHGLLQPLADVVKLITKEGVIPSHVNKVFYLMAPFVAVTLALISIAVIPFGPEITVGPVTTWMQLTDLNIGILFVLAVSSVGVYGVALGGWASNNKYALLGGLRSSAQMISYELPLALAVAAPLLLANTLSFRDMVNYQSGYWLGFIPRWNVWPEILGFVVFMIAAFAETNRVFEEVPFTTDSAEYDVMQAPSASTKIDYGYLPPEDAPDKPAGATTGANPLHGYTLSPLSLRVRDQTTTRSTSKPAPATPRS